MLDDIEQAAAMTPNLSLEELNIIEEQKMKAANDRPHPDFCGLSSIQMSHWLYSPFKALEQVTIHTPDHLNTSPMMRYLALMLDEAMAHLKPPAKATCRQKSLSRPVNYCQSSPSLNLNLRHFRCCRCPTGF